MFTQFSRSHLTELRARSTTYIYPNFNNLSRRHDFVSPDGTAPALERASSGREPARLGAFTQNAVEGRTGPTTQSLRRLPQMKWTKPEAEVVAVTLEVTAYVATL